MSHPLVLFKYCPKCGSANFEVHNFKSKHCPDCGFTYYQNPSSSTAAFILRTVPASGEKESYEELLVVTRGKEPAKGTLDLPGGFVDNDETGEQGMCREIKEETGLDVDKVTYLFTIPNIYLYSGMEIHTLDMFFECHVDSNVAVHPDDDAADCQWIPLKDIDETRFGLHSIKQAVHTFLQHNR